MATINISKTISEPNTANGRFVLTLSAAIVGGTTCQKELFVYSCRFPGIVNPDADGFERVADIQDFLPSPEGVPVSTAVSSTSFLYRRDTVVIANDSMAEAEELLELIIEDITQVADDITRAATNDEVVEIIPITVG